MEDCVKPHDLFYSLYLAEGHLHVPVGKRWACKSLSTKMMCTYETVFARHNKRVIVTSL